MPATPSRLARTLILAVLVNGVAAAAQRHEPSHAERFSESHAGLEEVERDATAVLLRAPRDVHALLSRARARMQLGKADEGLADFKQAVELAPDRADIRAQLALAHLRQGRFADARVAADAALALEPENPTANYALGQLLMTASTDLDGSIRHLERAAARGPAVPEVRFDLLRAYLRRGDRVRATVQLRVLRLLLPAGDARVLHSEGLLAAHAGRLDQAVDRFRQAAQAKPELPLGPLEGGLAIARSLARQGKRDQAIALFADAVRRFPENVEAHHALALALEQAGRREEARAEFERLEELSRKLGMVSANTPFTKP